MYVTRKDVPHARIVAVEHGDLIALNYLIFFRKKKDLKY